MYKFNTFRLIISSKIGDWHRWHLMAVLIALVYELLPLLIQIWMIMYCFKFAFLQSINERLCSSLMLYHYINKIKSGNDSGHLCNLISLRYWLWKPMSVCESSVCDMFYLITPCLPLYTSPEPLYASPDCLCKPMSSTVKHWHPPFISINTIMQLTSVSVVLGRPFKSIFALNSVN